MRADNGSVRPCVAEIDRLASSSADEVRRGEEVVFDDYRRRIAG
ncbi:hypothetical protein FHR81_002753 [Actinoalloteichus hoggarensis]|uniref:Uncharacterized protein n=1 Tax=Actinoalloteichus hoggarensis TaxID=1470176 RepID=A0A221VXR6_9PSEU|nr:hypothetical protein AHOG_03460 [Actinoalloteichus hoggarensis]MBB5921713.1 hypothetical protein [Actinoalloteichus hoggarensis]